TCRSGSPGCRSRRGCPIRGPGRGSRTANWCATNRTAARCGSASGSRRTTQCCRRRRCCGTSCGPCFRTRGRCAFRSRGIETTRQNCEADLPVCRWSDGRQECLPHIPECLLLALSRRGPRDCSCWRECCCLGIKETCHTRGQ